MVIGFFFIFRASKKVFRPLQISLCSWISGGASRSGPRPGSRSCRADPSAPSSRRLLCIDSSSVVVVVVVYHVIIVTIEHGLFRPMVLRTSFLPLFETMQTGLLLPFWLIDFFLLLLYKIMSVATNFESGSGCSDPNFFSAPKAIFLLGPAQIPGSEYTNPEPFFYLGIFGYSNNEL